MEKKRMKRILIVAGPFSVDAFVSTFGVFFKDVFENCGFEVSLSGENAISRLEKEEPFDFVLTDNEFYVEMESTGVGGLEVVRKAKEIRGDRNKVIFVGDGEKEGERAVEAGAFFFWERWSPDRDGLLRKLKEISDNKE